MNQPSLVSCEGVVTTDQQDDFTPIFLPAALSGCPRVAGDSLDDLFCLSTITPRGQREISIFGKDEAAIQKFAATMPVPEFRKGRFTKPGPLNFAKVAIVTTAALHREGADGFELGDSDYHYETLPRQARDLALGHHSVNFDRGGFAADINVVDPIDRLHEMAEDGIIGSVAENHYAFAGNQSETVSEIRLDSGPLCAEEMLSEGVDVVIPTGT